MQSLVTQGVRISVAHFYQESLSDPLNGEYVFAYRIRIENGSGQALKLMSRHWTILESTGRIRLVEGEGVRGIQPWIPPGQIHEYASWCRLQSDMGRMGGYYLMHREEDGELMQVRVPEFQMVAPHKLN
jgi:ApaG protein